MSRLRRRLCVGIAALTIAVLVFALQSRESGFDSHDGALGVQPHAFAAPTHPTPQTHGVVSLPPGRPSVLIRGANVPLRGLPRVEAIETLPHPSCLALDVVTQLVASAPPPQSHPAKANGGGPKLPRPTPVPLPPHHEYWREYAKPEYNCFKHGGHYQPGLPRRGGGAVATNRDALRRLELYDVYLWEGEWYQQTLSAEAEGQELLSYAAYFPMVAGNWPQPVVDSIALNRVRTLPWLHTAGRSSIDVLHKPVGYFQPPTDFASVYHVTVETILPLFHTLMDTATGRPSGEGISVVTSRARHTAYAFKPEGCALGHERCLDTVRGAMYLSMTLADAETARQLLAGTLMPSQVVGNATMGRRTAPGWGEGRHADNVPVLYGLARSDQQLKHGIRSSREHPFVAGVDAKTVLHFDRLLVGNPTHCEPLWGGDPHYAELLAQQHTIRGDSEYIGRGAGGLHRADALGVRLPQHVASAFNRSYGSCQVVLRAFRRFFLDLVVPQGAMVNAPLLAGPDHPVHILFTSRKGDWARQMLDEDELVQLLEVHVKQTYHAGSTVRAVRFGGPLSKQIVEQLDVEHTTLFIGNHGANLLNSIFLRPNAGVVTLSLRNPGFYPFSLFPEWLHVRDIVAEQMCNRRLSKGKCRWMEGNNNDMFLDAQQKRLLLRHVDSIVQAQRTQPRR